jgi:hypothetical protein
MDVMRVQDILHHQNQNIILGTISTQCAVVVHRAKVSDLMLVATGVEQLTGLQKYHTVPTPLTQVKGQEQAA